MIGQEVASEASHDDADQEMPEAAGCATDIAEGTVLHGGRIAETRLTMEALLILDRSAFARNEDSAGRLDVELL